MKKKYILPLFVAAMAVLVASHSCRKFENGIEVPSYIHIDSISVDCDYYAFGANTSNISDAWVYVDDQIVGCYELPATFPVLKKGPHKVSVYGGIKVDGRSGARAPYSFYAPMVYSNLNLVQDSVVNLNPVLNYYEIGKGTNVGWMEDFEQGSTLVKTSDSDTSLFRVGFPESWQGDVLHSSYSGKVVLPPDSLHFTLANSDPLYDLPTNSNPVLLELDYKCNAAFTVGLLYYKDFKLTEWPLVTVTPTDSINEVPQRWNKIYVNLGPTLVEYRNAEYFKVYVTSHVYKGTATEYIPDRTRYYYFDNMKLFYK